MIYPYGLRAVNQKIVTNEQCGIRTFYWLFRPNLTNEIGLFCNWGPWIHIRKNLISKIYNFNHFIDFHFEKAAQAASDSESEEDDEVLRNGPLEEVEEDLSEYTFIKFAATYFVTTITSNFSKRQIREPLLHHDEQIDRKISLYIWTSILRYVQFTENSCDKWKIKSENFPIYLKSERVIFWTIKWFLNIKK